MRQLDNIRDGMQEHCDGDHDGRDPDWWMNIQVHPMATVFPEMTPDERAELKESIRRDGLTTPIALYCGKVVDGRHRLSVCRELGIRPEFVDVDLGDSSVEAYVWAQNCCRRHLTASIKTAIAIELGIVPDQPGRTRDAIANDIGVSPRTVQDALTVQKEDPELFGQIKDGDISAPAAAEIVRERKRKKDPNYKQEDDEAPTKASRYIPNADERAVAAWKRAENRLVVLRAIFESLEPGEVTTLEDWIADV